MKERENLIGVGSYMKLFRVDVERIRCRNDGTVYVLDSNTKSAHRKSRDGEEALEDVFG